MQTHDYTKPPRTMPTTFARLEAANKRLTEENKMLREKFVLLEDGMSPHLAEVAETETHFILLGTPGSHNCDEMGCGSVGHHVLMRVHKSEIPKVETQHLEVLVDGGIHGILLYGHAVDSRARSGIVAAYGYGNPDELCLCRKVTKQLLADAPDAVKGETK